MSASWRWRALCDIPSMFKEFDSIIRDRMTSLSMEYLIKKEIASIRTIRYLCFYVLMAVLSLSQTVEMGQPAKTSRPTTDSTPPNDPVFLLPKPQSGCPSGVKGNEILEFNGNVSKISPSHLDANETHLHLCAIEPNNGRMSNKFCYLSPTDACPMSIHRTIPPVLRYKTTDLTRFCCKTDPGEPPRWDDSWEGPFYLLPHPFYGCIKVDGYKQTKECLTLTTHHSTFNESVSNTFFIAITPATRNNSTSFVLNFCYYERIDPVFLFPKPQSGCPSGLKGNEILAFNGNVSKISPSHLDANETHLHLCANGPNNARLANKFCYLSPTDACPIASHPVTIPPVLRYKTTDLTLLCCKTDPREPPRWEDPWKRPFYLLPHELFGCIKVDGYKLTRERLTLTTSDKTLYESVSNTFFIVITPSTRNNSISFVLNFCYYTYQRLDIGLIAGLTVAAMLLLLSCLCACCNRKRQRKRQRKRERQRLQSPTSTSTLSEALSVAEEENKKPRSPLDIGATLKLILDPESQLTIYGMLIHPDKLQTMDKVGKGAFGTVYHGIYKPDNNPLNVRDVAIKTLKDTCIYPEVSAFMEEAIVMADFNHVNVLGIVGVCVKPETEIPMIVLPFMKHGDLQRYCRQFRYDDTLKDTPPDVCHLLSFSLHIARGMEYLSNMKFIHRDLAARNCMLDSNMIVKVADFGLTRDVYSNSYYRQDKNKLLPVKWMAIESLQDRMFTSNTDVWSYGVTVWEIFTLGKVPYPLLENAQVLPELTSGVRLNKPDTCPDALYELMLKCWLEEPKERPKFTDVVKTVEEVLSGFSEYLDLEGKATNPGITSGIVCSPQELLEQARAASTAYADYRDVHQEDPGINK